MTLRSQFGVVDGDAVEPLDERRPRDVAERPRVARSGVRGGLAGVAVAAGVAADVPRAGAGAEYDNQSTATMTAASATAPHTRGCGRRGDGSGSGSGSGAFEVGIVGVSWQSDRAARGPIVGDGAPPCHGLVGRR